MSLQTNCPHCQAPLLLPEGCGGQSTRCPSCLQGFIVPETAVLVAAPATSLAMPAADEAYSEADLRQAEQRTSDLAAENLGLQQEVSRRLRAKSRLESQARWLRRFQAGRRRLDESIGRIGGFFVAIVLAAAGAVVLFSLVGLSAFGYFVVVALSMTAVGVAYIPFSYYPDDARLAELAPEYERRWAEAADAYQLLVENEAGQRAQWDAAEAQFQQIRAAVSSRLAWLRNCQWQAMNAKTLVKFLEQVFQEHGLTVEETGKMGQTGIDLVVVQGSERIAVQVKGVQAHAVEAVVVQQTDAGKGRFQCRRAAVITNAQFLPSARQLGDKLGVRLIDGSAIPELIEGRIAL